MTGFEYNVVPAPMRGLKGKGIKGTPARFANALQTVMNEMGAQGWEYQRTDTLPVEERQGLTGKTTTFQHLLVFRRPLESHVEQPAEVAALIEDQSDIVEDIAPEVDVEAEDAAAPSPELPTVEVAPAEREEGEARKAALSLEREDRVSETLKAPFAFPWNRRNVAKLESESDRPVQGD